MADTTSHPDDRPLPPDDAPRRPVLVWDAPVRVFHWLLVLSFAGAYLTGERDSLHLLHLTLGTTAGGLVAFRLLWGLLGTRPARFATFVRGPAAVVAYLRALAGGRPPHAAGHNPAGGWAIVGLLGLTLAVAGSGWALDLQWGGHLMEEAHEVLAHALLGLVGLHVAGVVVGSLAHRENLVRAMVSGRRLGTAGDAIGRPWRGVAVLLVASVLGFWAWQWLPPGGDPALRVGAANPGHVERDHDRDDDDD